MMTLVQLVESVGFSIIQFMIGLILSVFSIYLGIRVLDMFTKNLNEWKEIKKGNIAVGILLAAVVLSVAIVVESGVASISTTVPTGAATMIGFIIWLLASVVNLLIGVFAAMIGIYFSMTIFDQLTQDINEFAELKKGNIAVAILLSSVLLAVSFIIKGTVDVLIMTLNVAGWFGL